MFPGRLILRKRPRGAPSGVAEWPCRRESDHDHAPQEHDVAATFFFASPVMLPLSVLILGPSLSLEPSHASMAC